MIFLGQFEVDLDLDLAIASAFTNVVGYMNHKLYDDL